MFRDISDQEFDQAIRDLNVYGYTSIKGFIPDKTKDMLLEKTWHYYDKFKDMPYPGRPERDMRDLRIYSLQNKDMIFIDILGAPGLRRILIDQLNDPYYRWIENDKPNYILQNFNARSSGNPLDLHIDSRVPFLRDKPISLQAVFVLEDMDATNGCTVVAPGTHRSGTYTDRSLQNLVPLHSKAGDLVIWDSRLWHGTQGSDGNKTRWTLIASFCMWWMKQDLNMVRTLPEEFYAQMTDEQKQLIGYLSMPTDSEMERINLKCGYDYLKPTVAEYFR